MIFAVADEEKLELIIAASSEGADDLKKWIETASTDSIAEIEPLDVMRAITDQTMKPFSPKPFVATFKNAGDIEVFAEKHGVKLVKHGDAVHEQQRMMMYEDMEDSRTVGEIYDLHENDPHDTRTDEQKEAAKKAKDNAASPITKKKGKGEQDTQGSWAGSDGDGKIKVRDVKVSEDDDGNIRIDRVTAMKGDTRIINKIMLPNGTKEDYEAVLKSAGLLDYPVFQIEDDHMLVVTSEGGASNQRLESALKNVPHTIESKSSEEHEQEKVDPDWHIADDDMIDIYFRLEVPHKKLEDFEGELVKAGMRPAFVGRYVEDANTSWLAFVREKSATDNQEILSQMGITSDVVAVDRYGERVIEEGAGATVIDSGAVEEEPPFPWNEGADEFAKMTEEEQQKSLAGKWFVFSVRDYGAPYFRIVHITPRTYFNEHNRIWEGDLSVLDAALEKVNIKKYGEAPGLYQCKAYDKNTLETIMSQKLKMVDSMMLTAYTNTLRDGDQRTPHDYATGHGS